MQNKDIVRRYHRKSLLLGKYYFLNIDQQRLVCFCIRLKSKCWDKVFDFVVVAVVCRDAMCGKLFCEGGSRNLPWKGLTVSFLTCKLFAPEDTSQGIGMVANGTKCGQNKAS